MQGMIYKINKKNNMIEISEIMLPQYILKDIMLKTQTPAFQREIGITASLPIVSTAFLVKQNERIAVIGNGNTHAIVKMVSPKSPNIDQNTAENKKSLIPKVQIIKAIAYRI